MRIAIFGATSEIAKDLIAAFTEQNVHELFLYARRPDAVLQWLTSLGMSAPPAVREFSYFPNAVAFDAIVNFVGVGNPAKAYAMGASIFDVTLHYDAMALNYVQQHPLCRYIFMSSGAAYGSNFDQPVNVDAPGIYNINHLQPQDWYGIAKLHAEARHRALAPLPIIDLRVFNYFSHTQDMAARFIITDIFRAIRDKAVLQTSTDYIVRDYVHPSDFQQLVGVLLQAPPANTAVDCYSKAPIDKPTLLATAQEKFGLRYQIQDKGANVNATGTKPFYYSLNTRACDFGYAPTFTSLEGIETEMRAALSLHH
jgi:nucleoside-diphosphate-sugar epimerase